MSLVFWTERWKLTKTAAPSNQVTDPTFFFSWMPLAGSTFGQLPQATAVQFLPSYFLPCSSILQFLGLALVKALRQTPDAVET